MTVKRWVLGLALVLLGCHWALAYEYKYAAEVSLGSRATAISVSPEADRVAVVSEEAASLTVVDLASGAVTGTMALPVPPRGLAITRGNLAVVGTADGHLLVGDLEAKALIGSIALAGPVQSLAADVDGAAVYVGTDALIIRVDPESGAREDFAATDGKVVRLCAGKTHLAAVAKHEDISKLLLINLATREVTSEAPLSAEITSLAWDETLGFLLVTLHNQPSVLLFSTGGLAPAGQVGTPHPVNIVAVNPSTHEAFLSSAADGRLSIFSLENRRLLAAVPLFENLGPLAVDISRNLLLAGHDRNLALVQMQNPVPLLSKLIPEEGRATGQGVPLVLSGEKFIRSSETVFNEQPLPSEFVSNEQITTTIPESELLFPGEVRVAVDNPPPGGGRSNELAFRILTPLPQIAAIEPPAVAVGSPASKLRVRGRNFLPASFVNLGDERLPARFLSSTLLEVTAGAMHLAREAAIPITVTNPGKTVLTSNPVDLAVVPPDQLQDQAVDDAGKAKGFGSLEGRILNTDTIPLRGVSIKIGNLRAQTNHNGSFRLDNIPAGKRVILMDGSTTVDNDHYPTIPITVEIAANQLNPMPFQPYLHKQKGRNFVNINPAQDTILTDPELPGFELRIPKGVGITGWDGKRNLKVSVRTVPINRLPVKPVPKEVNARVVYMFYFDKVGGGVADAPIPLKTRNDLNLLPGEKAVLWYFDESPVEGVAPNDWAIAGTGTVTRDGKYIITDPGVGIPKFCCGATTWSAPANVPPTSNDDCSKAGDPVDMYTGYFVHEHTDLVVPGIIPVKITRYYRSRESGSAVTGADGLGLFGKGSYFEYDWRLTQYGEMFLLVKPGNHQHRFDTHLADGSYVNTTDPAMRGARLTVQGTNKVLRLRDGWRYTFNSYGDLVELADRNGNKLTFQRRSSYEGRYLQKIITAEGREIVFHQRYLDGNFFQTDRIASPDGRNVVYTYERETGVSNYRRLKTVQFDDGSTLQYGYDAAGRMNRITNRRGFAEVVNEYNADHRVVRQIHADGGAYTFSYVTAGDVVLKGTMTTPNAATTIWTFNNAGYLVSKTTPDGTYLYQTSPETNQRQAVTDPLDRTTRTTYYATTDARDGLPETVTDNLGRVTFYEYEAVYGLPTRIYVKESLGAAAILSERRLNYTFAANGAVSRAEMVDAGGTRTVIDFNGNGTPAAITTPDTDGQAGNDTSTFSYETTRSYLLSAVSDPLGNTVRYGYDDKGWLNAVTDPVGRVTRYDLDNMGRISIATDAAGGQTRYFRDPHDNLTMLIDPRGKLLRYEYDDRGRVTKMIDQKGREETYVYYRDAEIQPATGDNLKSVTDRKGQATTFDVYDPVGRLKTVSFADGATIQYNYDAGGRLESVDDSVGGLVALTYDNQGCTTCGGTALDKVKTETTALGIVEYGYDALGRRNLLKVPGAADVGYGYDDVGRLRTVTSLLGGVEKTFTLEYDARGRRESLFVDLSQPGGNEGRLLTSYGYDAAHRLVSLLTQSPAGLVEDATYGYHADGNRASVRQTNPIPLAPPVTNTTYSDSNEMQTINAATLAYDANGNLTSKTDGCGETVYGWDVRNRLTSIDGFQDNYPICTPLSADFTYDGLNRRTGRTVNGLTTLYQYDGWEVARTVANGVTTRYLHTLNVDEPLAFERSDGMIRYYVADLLGSIIALVDPAGAVKTRYAYDAYGNVAITGEPSDNPFQYTGRENDGTGLLQYRCRYYSPALGRFVSADPIGLAGGDVNYYRYVKNNPIDWVDPWGLERWHRPDGTHTVGRPNTIIEPGSNVGVFIENNFGSGYTFGQYHDRFVEKATQCGVPDTIINIPSMLPVYLYAVTVDMVNTPVEERPQYFQVLTYRW